MKRVILILAAVVLAVGSGCGRRCDFGTTRLQLTFTDTTGAVLSCVNSGTSFYRIFVDDLQVVDDFGNPIDFTCDGAEVVDLVLDPGVPQKIQIDAYDANEFLLYQFIQQDVSVGECGLTTLPANLAQVQGTMQFVYSIEGQTTCPPGSFVWYSIFDVTGNVPFSTVDAANNPELVPCGQIPGGQLPGALIFDKALFGRYRVDLIQIVRRIGFPAEAYEIQNEDCTPYFFDHFAENDVFEIPALVTSRACAP